MSTPANPISTVLAKILGPVTDPIVTQATAQVQAAGVAAQQGFWFLAAELGGIFIVLLFIYFRLARR